SRLCSRAYKRKTGKRKPDTFCTRPLTYYEIQRVVLQRGIKYFFDRVIESVNFVYKQNFVFSQLGKQRDKVGGFFYGRSGGYGYPCVHFVGYYVSQSSFSKPRRTVKQHVVEIFVSSSCRADINHQIFLDL